MSLWIDSLTAVPELCEALRDYVSSDSVIVSTDVGRVQMAARYAQCLGIPVITLYKRPKSSEMCPADHA